VRNGRHQATVRISLGQLEKSDDELAREVGKLGGCDLNAEPLKSARQQMQKGIIELPVILSQLREGGRTNNLKLNIVERLGGLRERVVVDQAARGNTFAGAQKGKDHLIAIDAHQREANCSFEYAVHRAA